MYLYTHKQNGKLIELETESFKEAHNSSFYAGVSTFIDLEINETIPVKYRIVDSEEDYSTIKK